MITNAQRTIFGVDLGLSMLMDKPYNCLPNTTLNEKFNILPNYPIEEGTYPKLKYYSIGVGGNDVIEGNGGYSYNQHSAVDAALFSHIPFVMRTLETDLTPVERSKYRFRKIEIFDNVEYACYYLKLIDGYDLRDYFYNITSVNGDSTLSVFDINTDKLLNPVPKLRGSNIEDVNTANYITKLAKLEFSLPTSEMEELKNVFNIRRLEVEKLTEIGICTGIDTETNDGIEAVNVQVSFHVGVSVELSVLFNNNSSLSRSIELGGSEPIIN
jgi:hypothetical protein